jgi:hypothetical protein
MGRPLDYDNARDVLAEEYALAEDAFREEQRIDVPEEIVESTNRIFASRTQAYREALIGCALAKVLDPEIDIRLPYMKQGDDAFNGRTLDQRVVNPFLRDRAIPCSTGPYLSSIRRSVRFVPETLGQRDQHAYDMLLVFLSELETADSDTARQYLRYLLVAFVNLREASNIALANVHRLSLEQYETLMAGLLPVPSGGWLPVLLAVATFQAFNECFGLNWRIEWQGINVADRAHGVGGDITVYRNEQVMFSVEVTEREIGRERVVSTFATKISPGGIDDYIFFFTATEPTGEARQSARQYFAQGHEINFIRIEDWIITVLGTIGPRCRRLFTERFRELLGTRGVPAALKVAWNEQVRALLAG